MTDLSLYKRADGLLEAGDDETQAHINSMDMAEELRVKAATKDTGTVPMLRTWRKWMEETARYMAWKGCTMPLMISADGKPYGTRPFTADDAHELFTAQWLGVDENGKRYSWAMRTKSDDVTIAPKSRRLFAMEKHLAWSTEKGIKLTIPRSSEYEQLTRQQNQ